MNQKQDFIWTDEKIIDFIRFINKRERDFTGYYSDIEAFKATYSREEGKGEWEIVSFQKGDGILWFSKGKYRNSLNSISLSGCLDLGLAINAVQRISDEVVFTVGEDTDKGKIEKIPMGTFGNPLFQCNGITYHIDEIQEAPPKVEKPPLGIMPQKIWKENRLKGIRDAVQRYLDADKPVPVEWIAEEYALRTELE